MNNRMSYQLFIDGKFVPSVSNKTHDVINPATAETIAVVSAGDADDVAIAVAAAKKAYASWKNTSALERGTILLKTADIIDENLDRLAKIECIDSGKPIVETIEDIKAIADQFRYFAGVIRADEGRFISHDPNNISLLVREPLGVVAQIIPWNFPFLLAGWKIAPALAAGNTIVIKPAELTPLSLLEFARLTQDVFPKGVFNIVTGSGRVVGDAMTSHEDVAKIAFTGSTPVGQQIAKKAAENIIPLTLELGGKSANIVFPDAPMEKAVESAAMAILYGQGQVCNAGSRLLLHEEIYDKFLEKLKAVFEGVKVGNPLSQDTRMGTMISENQLNNALTYVKIGIDEGATLLCGGHRIDDGDLAKGYYMEPTILCDATNDMRVAREEIFAPVLVVIKFGSEEEAIQIANDSEFGLAGACWTKDINRALRVSKAIQSGTVWINEFHLVPSHSPFGGYKKSGYGREAHKLALDSYSQIKNIYISLSEEKSGWYDIR